MVFYIIFYFGFFRLDRFNNFYLIYLLIIEFHAVENIQNTCMECKQDKNRFTYMIALNAIKLTWLKGFAIIWSYCTMEIRDGVSCILELSIKSMKLSASMIAITLYE